MNDNIFATKDPEILGGTPCFNGARVPIETLLENLANGMNLDDILDSYPPITREMALMALKEGQRSIELNAKDIRNV